MALNNALDASMALALLLAVVLAIGMLLRRGARVRQVRLEELKRQARALLERIEKTGTVPSASTRILLQGEEVAFLDEPSTFSESRAYRVSGGTATRVGRFYIGGMISESQQRLKQVDRGRLTLTNRRLVFVGSIENRHMRLPDIVSVEAWADAIEVCTQRRTKNQVFSVQNPLIWAAMVQLALSGDHPPKT